MTNRTLAITDSIYNYLLTDCLREPEILRELRIATTQLPQAYMQISPDQAQLMALLVELIAARKILEIGTFTGYSALAMALALPADGQLITCDISKEWSDIGLPFWEKANVAHKIALRIAPANETLDNLIDEGLVNSFDFAFIDANKKQYPDYYEKCLQLIRPGGLIALDNMLQCGRVADPNQRDSITKTIRSLNKTIQEDPRVSMSLVPIGDGLMVVRKLY